MMDFDKEFTQLELQIETLLKRFQEISNENNILRKKIADLLREKAIWQNKQEKTGDKLKKILHQIKDELT
jgi:uncharacterized protein (TIGR02449 family)